MVLAISIAATAAWNPAFPAFAPARSMACSTVSQVSTPKIVGNPCLGSDPGDAARSAFSNVVIVRRLAADHRAKADHRIELAAVGHHPGRRRKLERARHAHNPRGTEIPAVATDRVQSAAEQAVRDEAVEPRDDTAESQPLGIEVAFDSHGFAGGHERVSTTAIVAKSERICP